MKLGVFVHTNPKQYLGALVSAYSMRRASAHADQLRIEVINHTDYPFFQRHEGESYLIGGQKRVWRNDDLQSFTPLRFLPPELMGYEGRAVLVDPDVFAVGDIWELLTRDMGGKAIMCRRRPPKKTGPAAGPPASCCSTARSCSTGGPRKRSTSCSRSSATISTGSSCSSRTRTPSGRSRTSGTTSTG